MNRNGGPTPNGAADLGHLYAAMMTDGGQHHGTMVPGSNAFSLSHYQNMPKDQVDWAALAQQWIRMRESWTVPVPSYIPSPPPPPSFDVKVNVEQDQPGPAGFKCVNSVNDGGIEYEEQGEAPMEVEKEDEAVDEMLAPPVPSISSWPAPGAWPSVGHQVMADHQPIQQHRSPSIPRIPQHPVEDRPGELKLESGTACPGNLNPSFPAGTPASIAIAMWQAKNSHLFEANQPKGAAGVRPPSGPLMTTSKRANVDPKSTSLPGLMDREIRIGGTSALEPTPSVPNDVKDTFSGAGSSSMTEAKRKLLPAWIREGLEKMEREKQRQAEREQERRQWIEDIEQRDLDESPIKEDQLEQDNEPEEPEPPRRTMEVTVDEIEQKTKKILTEILMETTGEALVSISKEILELVQRRKAKKAASARSKTGLATCTGGLGLGIYGDSDDDDEDDEEEQQAEQLKKSFKDNGSDDDTNDNLSDGDMSESEAIQRLKEKVRLRQRDFQATASEIEQWLENTKNYPHVTARAPRGSRSPEDISDEDNLDQLSDDAAGELERTDEHGDTDSADGFGGFAGKSFQRTKHGDHRATSGTHDSVEHKRRDKRVSRFSDPRDTVRSTHITHVSIVSRIADAHLSKEMSAISNASAVVGTSSASGIASNKSTPVMRTLANAVQHQRTFAVNRSGQTIYNMNTTSSVQGSKVGESTDLAVEDIRKAKSNAFALENTAMDNLAGAKSFEHDALAQDSEKEQRRKEGDNERRLLQHRDSKKSSSESSRRRDRRDDGSHRRRYHRRSHSKSSRSSCSRSRSPHSRSSRSRSRDHSGSRSRSRSRSSRRRSVASGKHPSSSSRYRDRSDRSRRHDRDRSGSRGRSRSRESSSRRRRADQSRRSRSRSRSRGSSSSKYSSRRRY